MTPQPVLTLLPKNHTPYRAPVRVCYHEAKHDQEDAMIEVLVVLLLLIVVALLVYVGWRWI